MDHSDFVLHKTFWTETGEWRVTDIGRRVVVAIPLQSKAVSFDPATKQEETYPISEKTHPDWWNGPPYAIMEQVFDENDFDGCVATKKEYKEQFGETVTDLRPPKKGK